MNKVAAFYLFTLLLIIASLPADAKRVNTTEGKKNHNIPEEWKPLLNPKTNEFWKEGNHKPDDGFLLFAKNPTSIQYAKLWLLRMETKAKVLSQMQSTVSKAQAQMIKAGLMEDRYWQFKDLKKGKTDKRVSKKALKKLDFYFLFSSTCSHCRSLAKKLVAIPNLRVLQVDDKKIINFNGLAKTDRATKDTIKSYAPDGIVPVVVIHNPKSNVLTKVIGNKPIGEYYLAANSILKGGVK